jgi:hypothetical protein
LHDEISLVAGEGGGEDDQSSSSASTPTRIIESLNVCIHSNKGEYKSLTYLYNRLIAMDPENHHLLLIHLNLLMVLPVAIAKNHVDLVEEATAQTIHAIYPLQNHNNLDLDIYFVDSVLNIYQLEDLVGTNQL